MLEIYEEIESNLYRIEKQIKKLDLSTLNVLLDDIYNLDLLEKKVGYYTGFPYGYVLRKNMTKEGRIEYIKKLPFEKYINRTFRKIYTLSKRRY